ncbi:VacJ family lipoprotein [Sphingomonas naphthae]|uniref:VacJ family lipoprotein n=1 Tax=Sphingomonas naphthae TaxID=1813468 RepID=A0ABY7TLZ7_9SPHN|nr:VacJ family lipoprotein [Sphingomonas naphthae]WCT74240.1 VacJ family lipoprotein [Sphingomonas naphthae]
MTKTLSARSFSAVAALALLSGCATVGTDRLAERDPLEKFNRGVWGVNQAADKVLIKPVTSVYRAVAPKVARQGVSNAFSNLSEPWSFINNVLQGKPDRAVRTLGRFVINTTIGIGGLFDHASKMGLKPAREDLGQTLAVWGANGGPYLVLPLLGPSTMRDGIGSGVAFFADPFVIALNNSGLTRTQRLAVRAVQIISARSDLIESGGDAFLQSSLDPYAAARSAYLQGRRAQILDQEDAGGDDDAIVPTEADGGTPAGADEPIVPSAADGGSAAPAPAPAPAPGADDPIVPTAADGATTPAPAAENVPTPVGDAAKTPPASPPKP